MGIPELLIFGVLSLGAVWFKGKLDTVVTTSAVLFAWYGVAHFGWPSFTWSWNQALWYLGLTVALAGVFTVVFRRQAGTPAIKPIQDYVALLGWGTIQQVVLLSFMTQVSPWLAVAIFSVVHMPNLPLTVVTLLGGASSVAIMLHFGYPAVLVAGVSHALLSFYLRDVLNLEMGVGISYDD